MDKIDWNKVKKIIESQWKFHATPSGLSVCSPDEWGMARKIKKITGIDQESIAQIIFIRIGVDTDWDGVYNSNNIIKDLKEKIWTK